MSPTAALPEPLSHPERGGIFFRLLFLIFFLTFLGILYLLHGPILRIAGGFWVVDEPAQNSDAIVILSDDDYDADRASRAAQLYKDGRAPRVVASGRYLRPYASIAELMEHDLVERGVPASAVVRFPHRARDTREEAAALAPFLESRGWKKILVVTSNYHTRRAEFIFARTLNPGTDLRVVAATARDYDPDNWWKTREGVRVFFHESVGMVVALWEMRQSDVQAKS
jgi:uncharacterized SAM-binding protein YcdF (DUF218 family)